MVSSDDNTTAEISMNGQQLEEVTAFKYVGARLTKDGLSTVEIKTRLAIATDSMTNLKKRHGAAKMSASLQGLIHTDLSDCPPFFTVCFCLFDFLISSSTTRLYRGRAPRLGLLYGCEC